MKKRNIRTDLSDPHTKGTQRLNSGESFLSGSVVKVHEENSFKFDEKTCPMLDIKPGGVLVYTSNSSTPKKHLYSSIQQLLKTKDIKSEDLSDIYDILKRYNVAISEASYSFHRGFQGDIAISLVGIVSVPIDWVIDNEKSPLTVGDRVKLGVLGKANAIDNNYIGRFAIEKYDSTGINQHLLSALDKANLTQALNNNNINDGLELKEFKNSFHDMISLIQAVTILQFMKSVNPGQSVLVNIPQSINIDTFKQFFPSIGSSIATQTETSANIVTKCGGYLLQLKDKNTLETIYKSGSHYDAYELNNRTNIFKNEPMKNMYDDLVFTFLKTVKSFQRYRSVIEPRPIGTVIQIRGMMVDIVMNGGMNR